MIVCVFAIWDTKAQSFSQPFYAGSKGLAIRSFTDLVNDDKTSVNKYPDDFTLFELGKFDDSDGSFDLLPKPVAVGNALEFKTFVNTDLRVVS